MINLFLYGLMASILSLIGGLVVLWHSMTIMKVITRLITFAAGAFLVVAFLDLLPEAVEMVEEPHFVFVAALIGFFLFFALERILMKHSYKHNEERVHVEHTESLAPLVIAGDTLHNFLDGIAITLAYIVEPALGLFTAIAVVAHEIPQEIGDFAILLDQGWSKLKVLAVNIASSLSTLLGVAAGYLAVTFFEGSLAYLLGGTAGIFIYIAASDLIPEIHHRAGHKEAYSTLFILLLSMFIVGYLALKVGH